MYPSNSIPIYFDNMGQFESFAKIISIFKISSHKYEFLEFMPVITPPPSPINTSMPSQLTFLAKRKKRLLIITKGHVILQKQQHSYN